MPSRRLGEVLEERGLLDTVQVQRVLSRQFVDNRPFGRIAAEMFDLDAGELYQAIAEHLLEDADRVDARTVELEQDALDELTAEQARTHLVLPASIDDGELICLVSEQHAAEAVELLDEVVFRPFRFHIGETSAIADRLEAVYDA